MWQVFFSFLKEALNSVVTGMSSSPVDTSYLKNNFQKGKKVQINELVDH